MDIREEIRLEGKLEGIQKGMQKGMQQAWQEGRQEERQALIRQMLQKGSITQIAQLTGLTETDIKKLSE